MITDLYNLRVILTETCQERKKVLKTNVTIKLALFDAQLIKTSLYIGKNTFQQTIGIFSSTLAASWFPGSSSAPVTERNSSRIVHLWQFAGVRLLSKFLVTFYLGQIFRLHQKYSFNSLLNKYIILVL